MLTGPILFSIAPQQTAHLASAGSKVQSMESRLAETLAERPAVPPSSALELMEHLAILKRWYYRTSKVGEAFFADTKGELPLRRIVRGISRVLRGEKPAAEAAAPSLVPVRD
jgi:hypothetical protein